MFRRLKTLICKYIRSKDEYFFHFANRQYQTRTFYTIDQNENLITKYYRSTTSLFQTIAQIYRALDLPFTALAQQAKRVYALKFTVQSIEHLRNSPYLYPNTIYRHHCTYKSFSSTAIFSVLYPTPTEPASTVPPPPLSLDNYCHLQKQALFQPQLQSNPLQQTLSIKLSLLVILLLIAPLYPFPIRPRPTFHTHCLTRLITLLGQPHIFHDPY